MSCGRSWGGITWRRKADGAGAWCGYVPTVDAAEGVGERRKVSEKADGERSEPGAERFGVDAEKKWCAGSGVDTPSALASLASRWGAIGERGALHAGWEGAGESAEERGVSL